MEEQEKVSARYGLVAMENVRCALGFEKDESPLIESSKLRYQYKVESVVKMHDDVILVNARARYSYEEKELIMAGVTLRFFVEDIRRAINLNAEDQHIDTQADLFPNLVSTTYNTLRGIVSERVAGTSLERYPMPLVDIMELTGRNVITVEE